jgi:hypothetical protein
LVLKNKFKELKINEIVLLPLRTSDGELIDYVFAKHNDKILLKAFIGSNREEESLKAIVELEKIKYNKGE